MSHQAATQSVLHIEVKLKKVDEAHYVRPDLVNAAFGVIFNLLLICTSGGRHSSRVATL